MKRFTIVLLICVAAGYAYWYFKARPEPVEVPQTRETIAVKFAATDLQIKESPDDAAAVKTTRRVTEPISVVSEKDGWSEVKLTIDSFGWVRTTDLAGDKHDVGSTKENIRFRIPPPEVKERGRRGTFVWLKVAVNAYGDVTDVRLWQNMTGKKELTDLHTEAIKKAKFYPMMDAGGTTAPFTYDYKVEY